MSEIYFDDFEDLTPEERLDKIVELLTIGVLRLCEEQLQNNNDISSKSPSENPVSLKAKNFDNLS